MKQFKGNTELRLCRDDLLALLEEAVNEKILRFGMGHNKISALTLHPNNKYVIRLTLEPKPNT